MNRCNIDALPISACWKLFRIYSPFTSFFCNLLNIYKVIYLNVDNSHFSFETLQFFWQQKFDYYYDCRASKHDTCFTCIKLSFKLLIRNKFSHFTSQIKKINKQKSAQRYKTFAWRTWSTSDFDCWQFLCVFSFCIFWVIKSRKILIGTLNLSVLCGDCDIK